MNASPTRAITRDRRSSSCSSSCAISASPTRPPRPPRRRAPRPAPEKSEAWRAYKDRWFSGRLCLPGRRVRGASTHRHLSRRVRVPRPRHDLQHDAEVPRRHGQGDALPVQLGFEPLRLRAVRRVRFSPLQRGGAPVCSASRSISRSRSVGGSPSGSRPRPGGSPSAATAPDPRSRRTSSASTTSSTAISRSRSTVRWRSTGAGPPPRSPSVSASPGPSPHRSSPAGR